jgi:7,8-dihydro-6-hydroxymethylpterin-pyrophosphokinase
MGKNTAFPGGPRNIDIDLVMYGKRHLRKKGLIVPHPRFHQRRFVLVPLAELAPGYLHPLFRRRVTTLLKECRSVERVEQWGEW